MCVVWVIMIAVAIAYFCIEMSVKNQRQEQMAETRKVQNRMLNEMRVKKSNEYDWDGPNRFYRFIVDDAAKNVFIATENQSFVTCIPYSEILGFDVMTDDAVTGSVGAAVAGGVIAGGAGAILGSSLEKERKIYSYKAVIYRGKISDPRYEFVFIDSETDSTNSVYRSAVQFTNNLNAVIKAIIDQTKRREG